MADKYNNFEELKSNENEGVDYRVVIKKANNFDVAIIAPHGGGIEPGTSEISEGIAGNDFPLAIFEGIKSNNNHELHITSTNFNEPRCLALVESAQNIIAIHGEQSRGNIIYLGGANAEFGKCIQTVLEVRGFKVSKHPNNNFQGEAPGNICNRGKNGKGVQLEISHGLRSVLFESLSAQGRKRKTEEYNIFIAALREGIINANKL